MKIDKSISIEAITQNMFGNKSSWIYNYMKLIILIMTYDKQSNFIIKLFYKKLIDAQMISIYNIYHLNN